MDIVTRIQEQLVHLRPAERKVAEFIVENLTYSANTPIATLAQKAGVSQASITRVAQALGCTNVRELKIKLAQSAAVGERFVETSNVESKDIPAIYQSIHDILQLNAGLITQHDLSEACDQILNASQVLVLGVGGGSTIFAQECQNRFFRLGIHCNVQSDPMLMRMNAATVNKNDVVLALSLSGISPDVFAAAQIAKAYGAKLISLCPDSELSTLADVHLPIKTQEGDYIFKPSSGRYAMMAAIDLLANELAVRHQRHSREKLRRIKHQLDTYRNNNDSIPLGD